MNSIFNSDFVTHSLLCVLLSYAIYAVIYVFKEKSKIVYKRGIWQSKIYPEESGTIKIAICTLNGDDDPDTITAELSYSKKSKFKPDRKVAIDFDYIYDKTDKAYVLRQSDLTEGQCFMIKFKKNSDKYSKGYMVCVGPADLCEIVFERDTTKE